MPVSPGTPLRSRRRSPRARVSGDLEVWIEQAGVVSRAMRRFVVLGVGGAFLEVDETYPVGSELSVAFNPDPMLDEVMCQAVVRHALDGKGMGVEFVDLQPLDRARIQVFVEQHQTD